MLCLVALYHKKQISASFSKLKYGKSEILPPPTLSLHNTNIYIMIAHEISIAVTVQIHFPAEFWKQMNPENCQKLKSES